MADRLVAANPVLEKEFREGSEQPVNWLVDELMRETHGEYHSAAVRSTVIKYLNKAR